MGFHKPVLLQEVISFLDPKPGSKIIDATLGGGGHTEELLKRGARVLGIDRDEEAVEFAKGRFKNNQNLKLVNGNFSNLEQIAKANGFEQVEGIIFDLGVSSHQLEKPERGFSFQKEGPLDMRMDKQLTVRAYDIINNFEKRRIYEILETYGQEKHSWAVASAIYSARRLKPIETTTELAKIIDKAIRGVGRSRVNKATRVFQALRIVVNSEILNLEEALPQTVNILKKSGRLAIISFHSLEDQKVKRFFKQNKLKVLTDKPIGPNQSEVTANPRARSAKLRVAEKI